MKITDPDIIKSGEKDLIAAVTEDLDLEAVKTILEKRLAASTLTSNGGEIVVHNDQIAFRLDISVQLSGSLMFDRQGNYIPDSDEAPSETASLPEDLALEDLDIGEALEEVGPGVLEEDDNGHISDTPASDETMLQEDDPIVTALEGEDLDVDLPDYPPEADENLDQDAGDVTSEAEMALDEPDERIEEGDSDFDPLGDINPDDETNGTGEEDIDDILKESREFWEQKKES